MMETIKKYILEFVVFVSGSSVMIFEIAGARIIGPYFGTSIIIWTSIIGIILGSLSVGYYLGGKIADKEANYKNLSGIFLFCVLLLIVTFLIKQDILNFLQFYIESIIISALLASIVLFAPVSIVLGIVSPYSVKLRLDSLDDAGEKVGRLNALSTIGSIFGTFLSGFFLIPLMGTNNIFLLLILILLILSILLYRKEFLKIQLLLCLIIFLLFGYQYYKKIDGENKGVYSMDTKYSRITVEDSEYEGKKTRILKVNNEYSSAMFIDSDELVFNYTKYFDLGSYFFPDFENTIMIGGAGYGYPKYFLNKYIGKTMDVLEIDPGLTEIAKKFFNLKENKNLHIIHEDARTYFNKSKKKYDIIFGDAYKSQYSIPYHLTTKEFIQKKYDSLSENGLVVVNIISPIIGDKSEFLRAEYFTYKTIFPQVYIFQTDKRLPSENQNLILVALKTNKDFDFQSDDTDIQMMLNNLWKNKIEPIDVILTDDYAPVDYYINKSI